MSRYIDADALIAKMPTVMDMQDTYLPIHFKEWLIDTAPSIDMEPMRGKWIRDRCWSRGTGMGEEYGFFYKCSLCEYEVENGYARCGFNFCPYCGADMRKESE